MKKINFKQPKYIFPAVIFVPLCFLAYFVTQMIDSSSGQTEVATDRINSSLPEPNSSEMGDKLFEMQRRYNDDDAYTAVGSLGQENETEEGIDHSYTEEELNRIDAAEAEKIRQQKELEELERSLAASRKHINSHSGDNGSRRQNDYDNYDDYMDEMEAIQRRSMERQKMLERTFGINQTDNEAQENKRRQDSIALAKKLEYERNRPQLVLKSQDSNANRFNTVSNEVDNLEAPLIRAMIDQTTKAHEGTRIRFKLLDNVSIKDLKLPRGTYLYGTVSGFTQQRVMAKITSILIGNKFIKVDLSVYDNDGMEGFYVPESAFRDFMKDAGSSTIQQNIQFDSGSSTTGISGEALALQALQNVYNSATSAVSANIRKNRAKIKYNTIVYLINSSEAR